MAVRSSFVGRSFVRSFVFRSFGSFVRLSFVRSFVRSFVVRSFVRSFKKLGKIKIFNLNFLFYEFLSFSSISVDFGGARRLLMSKSDSLIIFAPGTQLLRSI